jgi:predicted ATPase
VLKSIQLRNFLSFGPESEPLGLRPLNVVIGPNGSGKSNLLEGVALIQSAPGTLSKTIREGGGVRDWLWKGQEGSVTASLEVVTEPLRPGGWLPLRYRLDFTASASRFEIVDERIENAHPSPGDDAPYFYYRYENNHPVIKVRSQDSGPSRERRLRREEVDPEKSIMAQRRDPDSYPEITRLAENFEKIRIYRDWASGRYTPPRLPQPADLPNQWLEESGRNLGLVLNRLRRDTQARKILRERFQDIYDGADDFDTIIEGGTVQIFVQEERFSVPATRLSDGTLRYLCLLAILHDPNPPPLICIDEPEVGLHPDLIHHVADSIRAASERTQVVVTTHSTQLVDAFTDQPEAILVCEKPESGTQFRRLEADRLRPWLEQYRLGAVWTSGELGGTRW